MLESVVAMKVLIVDDHALIRDALGGLLKKLKRGIAIFEAPDSKETLRVLEAEPDIKLVLLDLNLPDCHGLSLLREMRERFPSTAVVVLSALQDSAHIKEALKLGALGYIPKSARREVMVSALQLVFAGGVYIPAELLADEKSTIGLPIPDGNDDRPIVSPPEIGLSDRELQVLALLMKGKSNKVICRALDLSEPTVKRDITAILKALKAENRTQAVVAANELGWKLPTPS
jgi:DNA-binding NarL/FixJ family response regulator